MNILAMDTSNQVLGVAILKDNIVIGELTTNIPKNHSIRLMPAIDQLMKEVSMTPDQIDKIVVAKGPGSYTGVRIGMATAKSLAWALDIPIVGVSSLEALAYQGSFFDDYICSFFDARRGLVFAGIYQWKDSKIEMVYDEKNMLMEDVLQQIAKDNKRVLFISPDISIYRDRIKEVLGELAVIPEGPYHITKPSFLGMAGRNLEADSTHGLTPNYLRLAEAEANWLKAQKEK